MNIAAFTSICEEDADWIPQYLREVERLNMPFVMHFDRCSSRTIERVAANHRLLGFTSQPLQEIEFTEQHKQGVLDLLQSMGVEWALAWDVDETYEESAATKLHNFSSKADCLDTRWLNLWDDAQHIRVDGSFAHGHRVKLYNLQGKRRWKFDHPITNGPKLIDREGSVIYALTEKLDLICLHHGMMTPELRRMHKERWDRIYSTALRGDPNPYGFWKDAIVTEDQAILVRHSYRRF